MDRTDLPKCYLSVGLSTAFEFDATVAVDSFAKAGAACFAVATSLQCIDDFVTCLFAVGLDMTFG